MKNQSNLSFLVALAATASLASAQDAPVEAEGAAAAPERARPLSPRADRPFAPAFRTASGSPGDVMPDGAVFGPVAPRSFRNEVPRTAAVSDAELGAMGAPAFDIGPDRTRLHFDEQNGIHWVRGRSFKASATPAGFTYVPFLGSDASQNWPVGFRLASTTIGGAELRLDAQAKVDLRGSEFTLDRGPVDVEYEVALDGVEQLFHIERKGLSGEIVVTLDVETELFGAPFGGGLRFDGPEGGVDYGAAIAFDASGATVEVPVQYEAGTLRLTVPAGFVDAAAGDITIDPLLTSFAVDTVSGDQTEVDVAYTLNNDAFIYVYQDRFSGTDVDVYMTLIDSTGDFVDGNYVESGLADWVNPRVAQLSGDDVALIVATELVEGGDDPIQGRLYDTDLNSFAGAAFVIADTGGFGSITWTNAQPDVGGSRSSASGEEFFVCWERTLSTGGRFARFTTVDAAGNVAFVRGMGPTSTDSRVSEVHVSDSAGLTSSVNAWNVCFRNVPAVSGSNREVWAGQYDPDGNVVAAPQVVLGAPSPFFPSQLDISDGLPVNGTTPRYAIVYDDIGSGGDDVSAFVCTESTGLSLVDLNALEHAVASRNQDLPRVVATVDRFVVGYVENFGGTTTTYATTVDVIENSLLAVAERRVALPETNDAVRQSLALAARASAGSFSRWVGFGYEVLDPAGTNQNITGAVVAADNPSSPALQYCDGTVNSTGDRGFMRLEGTRDVGSNKVAVGEAIPPGQFCLLLSGAGTGAVPMLGGGQGTLCLGGTLGRYNDQLAAADSQGVVTFTINPANIPTASSFVTALPGDFYQWQIWHRDVAGAGPTSNLTNAVSILFN